MHNETESRYISQLTAGSALGRCLPAGVGELRHQLLVVPDHVPHQYSTVQYLTTSRTRSPPTSRNPSSVNSCTATCITTITVVSSVISS